MTWIPGGDTNMQLQVSNIDNNAVNYIITIENSNENNQVTIYCNELLKQYDNNIMIISVRHFITAKRNSSMI
jgi:hypothetical protein